MAADRSYRLIYSLRIDLGPIPGGKPDSKKEVIVNLDSRGQNQLRRGAQPKSKSRIVDLRVGDALEFQGQTYRVHGIETFREQQLSEAAARRHSA